MEQYRARRADVLGGRRQDAEGRSEAGSWASRGCPADRVACRRSWPHDPALGSCGADGMARRRGGRSRSGARTAPRQGRLAVAPGSLRRKAPAIVPPGRGPRPWKRDHGPVDPTAHYAKCHPDMHDLHHDGGIHDATEGSRRVGPTCAILVGRPPRLSSVDLCRRQIAVAGHPEEIPRADADGAPGDPRRGVEDADTDTDTDRSGRASKCIGALQVICREAVRRRIDDHPPPGATPAGDRARALL